MNEALLLENALLHAREELRVSFYRKYHERVNRNKYDPYWWAKKGWEKVQREGDFAALIALLRAEVPNGDLTGWWKQGRTKRDMLNLFTRAINNLPALELV